MTNGSKRRVKDEYIRAVEVLSPAFDMIKDPDNWKNPISTWIEERDFNLCNEACIYFTGAPLEITARVVRSAGADYSDCEVEVQSPGYYNTIGA